MADFVYSDINYKLNTFNKDLKLDYDNAAIKNSIRNILTIRVGSLVGNPEFGCFVEDALFEISDIITFSLIEDMIESAIEKWEPRIKIKSVDVYANTDENQIIATMHYYILVSTQTDSYNLVIG